MTAPQSVIDELADRLRKLAEKLKVFVRFIVRGVPAAISDIVQGMSRVSGDAPDGAEAQVPLPSSADGKPSATPARPSNDDAKLLKLRQAVAAMAEWKSGITNQMKGTKAAPSADSGPGTEPASPRPPRKPG